MADPQPAPADTPTFPPPPGAPPPGPEVQPAQAVTGFADRFTGSPFSLQQPQAQVAQTEATTIARKAEADAAAYRDREAKYAPIRDKTIRDLAMGDAEGMARRMTSQLQQVPKPPSIDPQRYAQNTLAFLGTMAALGALSSVFVRRSGTAALQAFGGALKGWQQGNMQAYDEKSKEWEQATRQTLENNHTVLTKYKAVLEAKDLDLDHKMMALKLIASEYQDKIGYNALAADNYGLFASFYDKNAATQDKAVESFLKLSGDKFHETEQNQAKARELETPQGQAWIATLPPEQQLKLQGFLKVYGSNAPQLLAGGGATGAGARNQVFADWRADYTAKNGRPPSPEEEKRFLQSMTVPRSAPAMALQKFMEENPEAKSADVVQFAATMQGDIAAIRAAGTRAGQIAVSAEEADSTFALAQQASDAFPRDQWQGINNMALRWGLFSGNTKARQFVAANEAAVTAYGATMSRNGVNTVAAQTRAHYVLDTADSPQAYAAGLEQLRKEVDAVRKAPARARQELLQGLFPGEGALDTGEAAPADHSNLSDDELKKKLGIQ